jgi:hypothetical protein
MRVKDRVRARARERLAVGCMTRCCRERRPARRLSKLNLIALSATDEDNVLLERIAQMLTKLIKSRTPNRMSHPSPCPCPSPVFFVTL